MEIHEILAHLEHFNEKLPREALHEATKQQQAITPELINILKYTADNIEEVGNDGDYFAPFYAIYLLSQFRAKEAWKIVTHLFSIPSDIVEDMFGETITEDLQRILASLYNGNESSLQAIIENPDLNEYIRSSALETYLVLYINGVMSRESIISYFKQLYHGKLEREYSYLWTKLATCSMYIYPDELQAELEQQYDEEMIEGFFVSRQTIYDTLNEGKDKALNSLKERRHYKLMGNAINEMERWDCFNKPKEKPLKSYNFSKPSLRDASNKNVGRNDPCPCGSGKKYKKCCLN